MAAGIQIANHRNKPMKPLTRKRARKVHRQKMRSEEYAYRVFIESAAKYCRCHDAICESVLSGGFCEYNQIDDDDEFVYQQYQ